MPPLWVAAAIRLSLGWMPAIGPGEHELVQRFAWGVPVYRQRFSLVASRPATERFYRLLRAAMAHAEQLREPFEGALECDESSFGGAREGKRGWGAAGRCWCSASSSAAAW